MSQTQLQVVEEHVCVQCGFPFDTVSITFEQRPIKDEDFCVRCWSEVMDPNMDEIDIQLPVIR